MIRTYQCRTCSGNLTFNPALQKLECAHCGNTYEADACESITEAKNVPASRQAAVVGQAEGYVAYLCSQCGAQVIAGRTTIATRCSFCGSPLSISENMTGAFQPDVIIPFQKSKADVQEAYKKLIRKGILTSGSFLKDNRVDNIHGVYVPFGLYSMDIHVEFDARVKRGKSSYTIPVEAKASMEHIPADASRQFDDALMDSVNHFAMAGLVPFHDAYMAGFVAEAEDDDEAKLREKAQWMGEQEIEKVVGDLSAIRASSTQTTRSTVGNVSRQKALMPVWLLNVNHRGRLYPFAMNGQTGQMVGKIPASPTKTVIAWILTLLILVALPIKLMGDQTDPRLVVFMLILSVVVMSALQAPYRMVKKAERAKGCIKPGTLAVLRAKSVFFDIADRCNDEIAEKDGAKS